MFSESGSGSVRCAVLPLASPALVWLLRPTSTALARMLEEIPPSLPDLRRHCQHAILSMGGLLPSLPHPAVRAGE